MAMFPSQDWCDAWKVFLNDSEDVAKHGKNWGTTFNGNMLLEIQPGGGLDQKAYLYCEAAGGSCSDVKVADGPDGFDVGFVVTGTYPNYVKVIQGKKDFTTSVLQGILKLQGNIALVMQNPKYIEAVSATFTKLDSEFHD